MNDTIRGIVSAHAKLKVPIDGVGDGDDLYAAGLTSLNTVSLMIALEDTFDLEFPQSLLNRATFQSIHAMTVAIDDLLARTT